MNRRRDPLRARPFEPTVGGVPGSQSGREFFFANGSTMMAVDVEAGPTFRAGTPRALFERPYQIGNYDVAPDGRFLLLKPVDNDGGELHTSSTGWRS